MPNIDALSLKLQKNWARLKFLWQTDEGVLMSPRFCKSAGWGGGKKFHSDVLSRAYYWMDVLVPLHITLTCCQEFKGTHNKSLINVNKWLTLKTHSKLINYKTWNSMCILQIVKHIKNREVETQVDDEYSTSIHITRDSRSAHQVDFGFRHFLFFPAITLFWRHFWPFTSNR